MVEISNILSAEMYAEAYEAVVFDLDDTLYSEKQYVKSGFNAVASVLPNVYGAAEKLWNFFEGKKSPIDELLVSENIFSQELKEKCLKEYRYNIPQIEMYDGVYNMLLRLKKKHKIGIITDGRPEGQRAKIKALNLQELADVIIITDELGGIEFRKPNTLAFEKMAKQLKVDYKKMCYTGDNIKKDFIAPEKLEMGCIWFKNSDGLYYKEK